MVYDKFFTLLKAKKITTYYIRKNKVVSEATLHSMRKGNTIQTDSLCRVCCLLECQPGDIMSYVPDEKDIVSR